MSILRSRLRLVRQENKENLKKNNILTRPRFEPGDSLNVCYKEMVVM